MSQAIKSSIASAALLVQSVKSLSVHLRGQTFHCDKSAFQDDPFLPSGGAGVASSWPGLQPCLPLQLLPRMTLCVLHLNGLAVWPFLQHPMLCLASMPQYVGLFTAPLLLLVSRKGLVIL